MLYCRRHYYAQNTIIFSTSNLVEQKILEDVVEDVASDVANKSLKKILVLWNSAHRIELSVRIRYRGHQP